MIMDSKTESLEYLQSVNSYFEHDRDKGLPRKFSSHYNSAMLFIQNHSRHNLNGRQLGMSYTRKFQPFVRIVKLERLLKSSHGLLPLPYLSKH